MVAFLGTLSSNLGTRICYTTHSCINMGAIFPKSTLGSQHFALLFTGMDLSILGEVRGSLDSSKEADKDGDDDEDLSKFHRRLEPEEALANLN